MLTDPYELVKVPLKAEKTAGGEWWITAPDDSDHEFREDFEPIFESSGVGFPEFETYARLFAAAPKLWHLREIAIDVEACLRSGAPVPDFMLRAFSDAITKAQLPAAEGKGES